jgi:hypothetical protein
VEPVTREAHLVHGIDVLSARLGGVDMLEATVPAGSEWANPNKRNRAWFPVFPEPQPTLSE